ncbi:MAG TPA: hypothetical protein VNP36_00490 [Burkholderiales bacterium]|nr:hypothetical protein [Burkholderiales bacterium]
MSISEPMTMATDYLLGGVTAWLAALLFKASASQKSRTFWAIAFAALAVAAFLGGTWHGVVRNNLLWKATLLAAGAASFAMVVASAIATSSGAARQVIVTMALAKLAVYSAWMLNHNAFIFVVIDTGVAFAVVLGLHLWRFNGWIVTGVAVSVAAALVQASGLALHEHFNHNDLYHVIQIAAMALFYRGARRLSDARAPTPAPPAAAARP